MKYVNKGKKDMEQSAPSETVWNLPTFHKKAPPYAFFFMLLLTCYSFYEGGLSLFAFISAGITLVAYNECFMFKFPLNKKPNKYEKISPKPFIVLAQEDPDVASKKLRTRYDELTDHVEPNAIGGMYKNEHLNGWYKLAQLLSSNDPALAKSIYLPLLKTRNYTSSNEIPKKQLPDMAAVSQHLYELENRIPETEEQKKLSVVSTLANCSSPDQVFWRDCLEQMFELASKHTMVEKKGYMVAIASTAFYAETMPELKEKALYELSKRLKSKHFLQDEFDPFQSRGSLLYSMFNFCIENKNSKRNISFSANSNSDLYLLLNEVFWQWVNQQIHQKSYNALILLRYAIMSNDENLSLKASEVYKQNFYDICVKNPQKSSECLREIASSSFCSSLNGRNEKEKHQSLNLYDVFDETIPILTKIDKDLGIRPFSAFLISHGSVPQRMQQKYSTEIGKAFAVNLNKSSKNKK